MTDRQYWVDTLTTISGPVLRALAERRLKATMPLEGVGDERFDRSHFSYLEAMARTLAGVAPWLEGSAAEPAEEERRREFAALARAAIDAATDPTSPDFVNFAFSYQPIVDAAFLAHALLRAPGELIDKLEPRVKANLVSGLEATRSRKPVYNNWLLFAALTEAGLRRLGAAWDRMRVDYALRQHELWYKGDGVYGDGAEYHADYYNSYVIQPMLVDLLTAVAGEEAEWDRLRPAVEARARRFGGIQERMIAPDGTFPPLGRSLTYRFGAFQHLSQMALQHRLPDDVTPGQVRSALTAMIRRILSVPGNFDASGWLRVGLAGTQLRLGERYISTGSLYLCTTVFLALGLPPSDPFWTDPAAPWTSVKVWSGADVECDHALDHDVF